MDLMAALLTLFGEVFDMLETYCAAQPGKAYMPAASASRSIC